MNSEHGLNFRCYFNHRFSFLIVLALVGSFFEAGASEKRGLMQSVMLQDIELDARQTAAYTGRDKISAAVMAVMARVPRHEFVDSGLQSQAYVNRPLPIGKGQTISQPFIVALMTDFLNLDKSFRVLEIGTGSGYQAAVLAELVEVVYTIEIIPELAQSSRNRLERLGYDNVQVILADGADGLKEKAPFDAIIVTAAAPTIPDALLSQLKAGGRMVIPLGREFETQYLTLVTKALNGKLNYQTILPVSFVPLTGKHRRK